MNNKILLTLGLSCSLALVAKADKKANVVFIIADDLTYNAMANLGEDVVITPNLDRLRKSGAYFTHAFNQGAYSPAVSAASRTMLNTGKYIWRAQKAGAKKKGKNANQQASVEKEPLWSEYMKQAGYTTYMAGKWHVQTSAETVFDVTKNVRGGMPKTIAQSYAKSEKNPQGRPFVKGETDSWSASDTSIGGHWLGGKHWSEVLKDDALEFISSAKKSKEPFFMYLGFNAPHDPRQSPQKYLDMYDVDKIKVPENFQTYYPYNQEMGANFNSLRDERLLPNPRTPYSVQVSRREYYALITHMDAQIGEILDAIEKSGKAKETYIIFTADHGLAVGDHGFCGKQNMYDASMRVPLFVSGPGIKAGTKVDGMVYLQDAMATALDIAGSDAVDKVDFKSLLSLAKGAKTSETINEAVYGAYITQQRMVRTNEYKMIIYPKANVVRLYNLKKDPKEMVDLAGDAKNKPIMDELLQTLLKLQKDVSDVLDVKTAYNTFFAGK